MGYSYEMFALTGSAQGVVGPAAEIAMKLRLPQKGEKFLFLQNDYQLLKDYATYFSTAYITSCRSQWPPGLTFRHRASSI